MPLFDVTFKDYYVNPKKAESSKHIQAVKNYYDSSPKTFPKILHIIDEAINSVKPSASSKLIWTKTGALFGRNSDRPLRDVEYVWDKVIGAVGDDKNCLIALGALFRWRVSLRPEMWLAYRQDSDSVDPSTGRAILISTYWIDVKYKGVLPRTAAEMQAPPSHLDMTALAQKFNGNRNV